jgi:hypothetical protein
MLAEKRKALGLALNFATAVTILGLLLTRTEVSELVGRCILIPGFLVELGRIKMGLSSLLVEDRWDLVVILGVSWLFYFTVFYLIAHWLARRGAAAKSPSV